MKILDIEEASVEYCTRLTDVSTPETAHFTSRTIAGTLRVEFLVESGDEMHSSVSNVITALRKYVDDQPLPK